MQIRLLLKDEAATLALGAALAAALPVRLTVYLRGDLGAGKTTLTRGLLRALGHTGNVKSPTYTLVEPYVVSRIQLYHFDFYRLNEPDEYLDAGMDEYFAGDGIRLVEWPDKAAPYLDPADLEIQLDVAPQGRSAELNALTENGTACLARLASDLPPQVL
ncbi:MAG: tRNA (adenosine(37)-N6)-threonylcarbamoyltransferase complex ATPase subunit type 1 TsaE [Zoogloea sp.]|nr:tRNA (adenosine(37)-N6)-threonylcarbamoyltransferase complex ATPase subunit type 1 TsaE [Zoogloea sp.]